jgi:PAS domain S-box-containing protein
VHGEGYWLGSLGRRVGYAAAFLTVATSAVTVAMVAFVPPSNERAVLIAALFLLVAALTFLGLAWAVGRSGEAVAKGVLEAVGDAVIGIDGDGRVIEWNRAAERTFGWSRSEALGGSMADMIIPAELRPRHLAAFGRVAAGGEPRILGTAIEFVAQRRDGSPIPVEINIAKAGGRRPIFTASLRDVTSRHTLAAERELIFQSLLDAEERTRASLASDLHDDTVQVMVAVLMSLDRAIGNLREGRDSIEWLERSRAVLADATTRTRRLLFELRPALLTDYGLGPAVRALAVDAGKEANFRVAVRVPPERYSASVEGLAYRSIQEVLANARKHSRANHVTIDVTAEPEWLVVRVGDDGRGFDLERAFRADESRLHIGLQTMIERIQLGGGSCQITTRVGEGVVVDIRIPLPPRQIVSPGGSEPADRRSGPRGEAASG